MISKRKRNKVMRILCNKYYTDYKERIGLGHICRTEKLDPVELKKICVCLESLKFLNFISKESLNEQYRKENYLKQAIQYYTEDFVSLTDEGKCYFETKSDKIKEFLKNSIIVPITVSILTTAILYIVQQWLIPYLKQYLSLLNF